MESKGRKRSRYKESNLFHVEVEDRGNILANECPNNRSHNCTFQHARIQIHILFSVASYTDGTYFTPDYIFARMLAAPWDIF